MRDFTIKAYTQLINVLQNKDFCFQTFERFIMSPEKKALIMRHDVDRLPGNALKIAELEESLGVRGSYYFRVGKQSFNKEIIERIASMGHEIGYHYENLSAVARRKGFRKFKIQNSKFKIEDMHELVILDFEKNLKKFREIVPVKTICMHGSPTSKYDSRDIWGTYDYRDFGIIGEPYFDIDFSKVLYLTDTGRRWDGDKFNIRDRVLKKSEEKKLSFNIRVHSTFDIIDALEKNLFPDQIMINTHPQRWTNNPILWTKELVWQNMKNLVKRFYT